MSKSVVTSRRSFIKGAVAGAVSAGVAPVMAAPAPQNGLPAKWDGEADVVIVGFGGAGATTGIVAAQNGAKVIILEKNPQNHHYSNTRMSGGIFHCPFKDGDPKALKDYAQAMFSGENIDWKEEGEIPEYSEGLAQLWQTSLRQTLNSCRAWTRLSSAAASPDSIRLPSRISPALKNANTMLIVQPIKNA